jgi:hypothetical protein
LLGGAILSLRGTVVVFLTYRTISTNAKKERRAAKKEEREAQGPL